jgi:hypothetical protein
LIKDGWRWRDSSSQSLWVGIQGNNCSDELCFVTVTISRSFVQMDMSVYPFLSTRWVSFVHDDQLSLRLSIMSLTMRCRYKIGDRYGILTHHHRDTYLGMTYDDLGQLIICDRYNQYVRHLGVDVHALN